ARSGLGHGRERETGVRADEEGGVVCAGRARLTAFLQLAYELALPHPDAPKLGRDGVGERGRGGVPLCSQLERELVDAGFGLRELACGDLGRIGPILQGRQLGLRPFAPREQLLIRRAAETTLRPGNPVELRF